MPDHRAHGASGQPHDPALYPKGMLARDLAEFVAHLGLKDFDLGGFSLGARTVVEAVGEGLRPRKAVLAGMGLDGLLDWDKRQRFFVDAIAAFDTANRGDPHWLAIQFMKTMKVDREAAKLVLASFGDAPRDWLGAFSMPTLVLIGSEDEDNGSARALAEALPDATYEEMPGTHMSSVTKPDLGLKIAEFLARLTAAAAAVHSAARKSREERDIVTRYFASVSVAALAVAGCAMNPAPASADASMAAPVAPAAERCARAGDRRAGARIHRHGRKGPVRLLPRGGASRLGQRHLHHRGHGRAGGEISARSGLRRA